VCHDWGTCWGLKFCPYGACGDGRVGFLAGTFGDGLVRVVDVREEWVTGGETVTVKVLRAGWKFDLGGEFLATCCAWKSHTELLVGGSNGIISLNF
jgi:hypothetical protein